MKRLVLVCQVFHPDPISTSQLLGELFHSLRNEAAITVLCGFPTGYSASQLREIPRRESVDGINVFRCGLRIGAKRNALFRAISYITFLVHALWRLAWMRQPDELCGVTNPPFMAVVLLVLRITRGHRYKYIIHDLYPEGLVSLGLLRNRSIFATVWRSLNRRAYRKADKLVVLGRDTAAVLESEYGIPSDKITYIPHWSVFAPFTPMPFGENPMAGALGIQDKFVVQYSGNMGLWHDIDSLVRAADRLRGNPKVHFLFIGDGLRRDPARRLARELGLNNVTWLDFVPKEELPVSLSCCHVALISLKENLDGVAVPCKLYGILASGRCVVAQVPRTCEVAMVVREEGCGFVVDPNDVDGLVDAIRHLADDPARAYQMGRNAYRAYETKYTLQSAVTSFRRLFGLPVPWKCSPRPDANVAEAALER